VSFDGSALSPDIGVGYVWLQRRSEAILPGEEKVGGLGTFFSGVWTKLEKPVTELVVHFIVTVLAISSIRAIEWLLHAYGIEGKVIPFTTLPMGDWMFSLEVLAASVIILVGVWKATCTLWNEP
jgi:hypothetical protein